MDVYIFESLKARPRPEFRDRNFLGGKNLQFKMDGWGGGVDNLKEASPFQYQIHTILKKIFLLDVNYSDMSSVFGSSFNLRSPGVEGS
jgi:hypothetical protein